MPRRVRVKGADGLSLSPEQTQEARTDPLQLAASRFAPRTSDAFAEWTFGKLGTMLTPQQLLIDESMIQHRYTAVPSCHSSGKSRFSAMKAGHFLDSHTLGSAFFVSTAPSSAQVEGVLWRELRRVHSAAELRGRITRSGFPQWHVGDELVGFGRRPKEIASFQGTHARFVLIVIEEADGVPEELWVAVDSLASSGVVRILAIGNPDSSDSHFAKVCQPGSGWNIVRIDGLRTPNMTEREVRRFPELYQYYVDHGIPFSDSSVKDVPIEVRRTWRESLLSPEWVAERMQVWGVERFVDEDGKTRWRESSLWQSKVRGQTPSEGAEGIIPLAWVERAMSRWEDWRKDGGAIPEGVRLIQGCDVADTGKDETVMPLRYGPLITSLNRIGQQDTETTTERIKNRIHSTPGSLAVIDAGGLGVAIYNRLRRLHVRVLGFVGAASAQGMRDATGEFTFANTRSAAYWHLREMLDPLNGPDNVCLPRDPDLLADLTVPKWTVKTGAVIALEPKDKVTKRLGRSPDCGDGVVMTFWPSSGTGAKAAIHEYSRYVEGEEWDPPISDLELTGPTSPAQRREQRLARLMRTQQADSRVFTYSESVSDGEW